MASHAQSLFRHSARSDGYSSNLSSSEPSSSLTDGVRSPSQSPEISAIRVAKSRRPRDSKRREISADTAPSNNLHKRSRPDKSPKLVEVPYTRDAVDAVMILGINIEETAKIYKVDPSALKLRIEEMANESLTEGTSLEADSQAEPVLRQIGNSALSETLPEEPEVEAVLDVRTKRHFLVRWQGESKEEATWVDEDIFNGLCRPRREEQ
ncbi:hypothetical protein RvY_10883 [Ramazzottius varieornatus]|uniref:Chromo domain-containing protein n=1 Tax=Ramazzottius varieornatus TaxID=947166 RepID=A0A1D1VIM9_RAMVA|nr:hypothetical protein RvY_10883 [Ramazzottius varieornatus]